MSTTTIRADKLTGAALDYMVALATREVMPSVAQWMIWDDYHPSTNWSHAGPLIERRRPALIPVCNNGGWCAEYDIPTGADDYHTYSVHGETALIAACRAIVAERFGDEVKVPSQLLASVKTNK